MAILTVGAGQQYSTIAAAVAASRNGDVIEVQAGTYTNDFATINTQITIRGVGGMAKLVATVSPPNGKGILVTNTDVTIQNLEFSGARVPDFNGAGIRYQGGHLTVENSYFHHNEMGLLSNDDADGSITIRNSEFANNGYGDGYSHNLYVNRVGQLTVDNSYFHDAVVGHQLKSRAANTIITNSRLYDGTDGNGSYSIDLPNGGKATISGNTIVQGANSGNPAIISFGAEGSLHAASSLSITDNVVINDRMTSGVRMLNNHTSITAQIDNADVYGLTSSQIVWGSATVTDIDYLGARPSYDTTSPWTAPAPTPPPPPPSGVTLNGTTGADTLTGGSGDDVLNGGAGNDKLYGNAGADHLVGGTGNDTFYVDNAGDIVTEYTKQGVDTVVSTASTYTLGAYVENLTLGGTAAVNGSGNDYVNVLTGNAGANTLSGLGGNDSLIGNAGNDTLIGGAGNDVLSGGTGADRLTGGTGSDRFDWNSTSEVGRGTARDVITDLVRGEDKIDLSGIDAVSGTATNDAFKFVGAAAFSGTKGELHYLFSGTDTLVQGDVNGDKVADFEFLIQDQLANLQTTDFVL